MVISFQNFLLCFVTTCHFHYCSALSFYPIPAPHCPCSHTGLNTSVQDSTGLCVLKGTQESFTASVQGLCVTTTTYPSREHVFALSTITCVCLVQWRWISQGAAVSQHCAKPRFRSKFIVSRVISSVTHFPHLPHTQTLIKKQIRNSPTVLGPQICSDMVYRESWSVYVPLRSLFTS